MNDYYPQPSTYLRDKGAISSASLFLVLRVHFDSGKYSTQDFCGSQVLVVDEVAKKSTGHCDI